MTMHDPEMLSMLIDGECDAEQAAAILRQTGQSDAMKARWHSYHLVGDALRHSLPDRIDTGLSARIALALESEPAYLLPGHASGVTESKPATPNTTPAQVHEHPRFRFGAAAGFAMAASLSAIAVFNLGQTDAPVASSPAMTAKVEHTMSTASMNSTSLALAERPAAPVATGSGNVFGSSANYPRPMLTTLGGVSTVAQQYDDGTSMSYPTEAADLYDYLVNYGRYSAGAGQNEMLAHISLATYGTSH